MEIVSGVLRALAVGVLLYAALRWLVRPKTRREPHAPLRTDEAVLLIAVGGGAAQVFAVHSWLAGLLALTLLLTLDSAGQRLRQRVSASPARPGPSPLLLVYRGQVVPGALAVASLTEAELDTLLRRHGVAELTSLHAVVQEPDGRLGIIQPSAPLSSQLLHPLSAN